MGSTPVPTAASSSERLTRRTFAHDSIGPTSNDRSPQKKCHARIPHSEVRGLSQCGFRCQEIHKAFGPHLGGDGVVQPLHSFTSHKLTRDFQLQDVSYGKPVRNRKQLTVVAWSVSSATTSRAIGLILAVQPSLISA